jgi:hypothetical protein
LLHGLTHATEYHDKGKELLLSFIKVIGLLTGNYRLATTHFYTLLSYPY